MADKEKKGGNTTADMQWTLPDVDSIRCKDCVFAAKNRGSIKGAALATCECYPQNDKPVDILLEGKDCIYFVDKNTK